MATIIIPLAYYTPATLHGAIEVEPDADGSGDVVVTFRPHDDGATQTERVMSPGEARALAAALVHFADEAEA